MASRIPRLVLILGFTLIAVLWLAACGGGGEITPTSAPIPTREAAATPTASGPTPTPLTGIAATLHTVQQRFPNPPPVPPWPPKVGGQFRTLSGDFASRDPGQYYAAYIYGGVYNSLLEDKIGLYYQETFYTPNVVGDLAEKWEQKDPLTYVFYLRKGVKWQNIAPVNGREVTAEDVKWSYEKYMQEPLTKHKLRDMAKMEVLDKYTLQMTLKAPYGGFLEKLASPGYVQWILAKEVADMPGAFKDNSVGSGPFVLTRFTPGEGWQMDRNADYWERDKDGTKLPYLDSVRAYYIPDVATQFAAFRSKQVDNIEPSMIRQIDDLLKTNPDIFIRRIPPRTGWGGNILLFRLDKAPWNDVRVRRAVSMALDREKMNQNVFDGDAYPLPPMPWAMAGFTDWPPKTEWLGKYYQYNPEEAKRLLAEAGFPNGFKTTITYVQTTSPWADALIIEQDNLRKIGIDAEIKALDAAAYTASLYNKGWDNLRYGGPITGGYDFDDWVYVPHYTGSPVNYDGMSDPEIDRLLDKHRAEQSEQERAKLARQIWDTLTDKVYRVTNITPHRYNVTHPYVQNYAENTYAWAPYYGSHQIVTTWLEMDAPGRKK